MFKKIGFLVEEWGNQHFRLFLSTLGIGTAIAYFLWRADELPVWSDTPYITANRFDMAQPLTWKGSRSLPEILGNAFGHISSSGYRPVTRAIQLLGIMLFSDPSYDPRKWYAVVGFVVGCLAVAYFLVARRFLHSNAPALLATFFFLSSTAFITGAWPVLDIQAAELPPMGWTDSG